jgi:hypothetical protein
MPKPIQAARGTSPFWLAACYAQRRNTRTSSPCSEFHMDSPISRRLSVAISESNLVAPLAGSARSPVRAAQGASRRARKRPSSRTSAFA